MGRRLCLTFSIIAFVALLLGTVQTDKKDRDRIPQVHFQVDVVLRMLDVIVLDKDDKHVEDLTMNDFEVYEEGKLQNLVVFDNISFKVGKQLKKPGEIDDKIKEKKPGVSEPLPQKTTTDEIQNRTPGQQTKIGKTIQIPPEAAGRSIVLLFDNYNTHYSHLVQTKDAAKQFITNDLLPEDKVAVIRYYGSAKVLQEFTNDKGKLFNAINSLSISLGDAVGKPEIADTRRQELYGGGGYQGNAVQGLYGYRQPEYEVDSNWDPDEKIYNVKNFVDVLRVIGYFLKDVPGRKTIIFLSPGFLGVSPVSAPWMFVNMGRVLERLSGYNVTLYSIDVTGVATDTRGKREERWDFLTYVSDKTGGKLFKNKNDLHGQLQRVNYEISRYYLLGYYSDSNYKDGRFIKVDVKCKRPGTKVRTVKGLYAARSWEMMPLEERRNNLHRLLGQGNTYIQIPIKVEGTSALPSPGGKIIYPLTVRFPVFRMYKDYDYLSYDLYLLIKDANNAPVDNYFQEIRIDKQNLVGDEFIVNFPMALKAGEYIIEMIIKNNVSEELGSNFFKVRIPGEIKGLAASEPKIFTSDQTATILFPESAGLVKSEDYYPHIKKHMIPCSGKKLYIDEETVVHFSLLNYSMDIKKEQADVDLEFALFKEGQIITKPLDVKKFLDGVEKEIMTVLVRIPPDTLVPGRYNLRIYCKDNSSGQILTKQLPMFFTDRQKSKKSEKKASQEEDANTSS